MMKQPKKCFVCNGPDETKCNHSLLEQLNKLEELFKARDKKLTETEEFFKTKRRPMKQLVEETVIHRR